MKPQPEAAIVNNAFAKKLWPNEDPMGKHILLRDGDQPRGPLVVVGLVGDVKQFGLATDPRPEIYLPMRRNSMTLIVRTGGNTLSGPPPCAKPSRDWTSGRRSA